MASITQEANKNLFARSTDESYPDMDSFLQYLSNRNEDSSLSTFGKIDLEFKMFQDSRVYCSISGMDLEMNNWSFKQFCALAGAPIEFLSKLSPNVLLDVLNDRKSFYKNDSACVITTSQKPTVEKPVRFPLLRSVCSTHYAYVPDFTIAEIVNKYAVGKYGMVPGGHMAGRTGVGISAEDAQRSGLRQSAGLYVGERDMFMFMLSPEKMDIDGGQYYLGFYTSNSEVRDKRLSLTNFVCDGVCANHLIWGAKNVSTFDWVHKGNPDKIIDEYELTLSYYLSKYSEQVEEFTSLIHRAKDIEFAPNEEEAFKLLTRFGFAKDESNIAVGYAKKAYDTRWNNLWSISSGLTYCSQTKWNQDDRNSLDIKAADMLQSMLN